MPVIADSVAQTLAAARLRRNNESIRAAFDELGLGWDLDDVRVYLEGSGGFMSMDESTQALVTGWVMAFGILVFEQSTNRTHPWERHGDYNG